MIYQIDTNRVIVVLEVSIWHNLVQAENKLSAGAGNGNVSDGTPFARHSAALLPVLNRAPRAE